MLPFPPFEWYPNTVRLENSESVVVIAELKCSYWADETDINTEGGPVTIGGEFATMWCDFDERIQANLFIIIDPVADGHAGVDERYLIRSVDNVRGISLRMKCGIERAH